MQTARQIIASEAHDWMEKADIQKFCDTQLLEEITSAWEYGKWCAKGARHSLGHKSQIKFRGSKPDSTAWDAIVDISDDKGMEIHAATVGLSPVELEILDRIYLYWQPSTIAVQKMSMRTETFFRLRKEALMTIAENLLKDA